jgi:hypothetical protein
VPEARCCPRDLDSLTDAPEADRDPVGEIPEGFLDAPAARSVGISKGTGLHSLRHYFPTRLILDGASVKRYAFGNSSRTITLNTYVGEWPDTDHHTLDR